MSEKKQVEIGIIMLETRFPRILGDIGNPDTFSFPVSYKVVKGATPYRIVKEGDPTLLNPFIRTAQEFERENVKAIGTSCGFLAIFQQEMQAAVNIPLFSSSLLQVHYARSIIRRDQTIGIITADKTLLSQKHFAGIGIQNDPLIIIGMDDTEEFRSVYIEGKKSINISKCRNELIAAARKLAASDSNVGAIVLECTNMAPFSADIQQAVKLPVFDVVTMINYSYSALTHQRFKLE
jgi:aspartate/glutamate racemase